MKATIENIRIAEKDRSYHSYVLSQRVGQRGPSIFTDYWHYHPEIEITYVVKGEGLAFIGNKIVGYLSHTWTMLTIVQLYTTTQRSCINKRQTNAVLVMALAIRIKLERTVHVMLNQTNVFHVKLQDIPLLTLPVQLQG